MQSELDSELVKKLSEGGLVVVSRTSSLSSFESLQTLFSAFEALKFQLVFLQNPSSIELAGDVFSTQIQAARCLRRQRTCSVGHAAQTVSRGVRVELDIHFTVDLRLWTLDL